MTQAHEDELNSFAGSEMVRQREDTFRIEKRKKTARESGQRRFKATTLLSVVASIREGDRGTTTTEKEREKKDV